MFNKFKRMLGYEPIERKLIGHYFYYSNLTKLKVTIESSGN